MTKPKADVKKQKKGEVKSIRARRHAPGEWSEVAVPVKVKTPPAEVLSFRLPGEELDQLENAADLINESISEFIRKAIALRIHGQPIGPAVDVTGTGLRVRSVIVNSTYSENSGGSLVGDLPPLTVASL